MRAEGELRWEGHEGDGAALEGEKARAGVPSTLGGTKVGLQLFGKCYNN